MSVKPNRRNLLALFAGMAVSGRGQITRLERRGIAQRILVVGGGLAGLCSAYELSRQGHDVLLFEAQARPGGRVKTLREGLGFGLTAEAGAGRIPGTHEFTLHYVREFGLELEPFRPTELDDTYYVHGRSYRARGKTAVQWPLDLSPEEAKAGLSGLQDRYINTVVRSLGRSGLNAQLPPAISRYDGITFREFLLNTGLSRDAVRLLTLGFNADVGSAAWWLLDELNYQTAKTLSHIKGGNDLLPRAFATRLERRVSYGSPVIAIGQDDSSAWVVIQRRGERQLIRGQHVVCAAPFSVVWKMFSEARLARDKQELIGTQEYTPSTKVFLQTKSNFWRRDGLSGFAYTDLPLERLWALDRDEGRSLLIAYTEARGAVRLDAMTPSERLEAVFVDARRVFPKLSEEFEGGVSHSWANDPWQRGAWAQYNLGQIRNIPLNARREGRIHFAGEHTSCWNGWMQGALESAHRVIGEIDE
jgi:monoamine oxidase